MSMYPARCRDCGFKLYANTHEEGLAVIPGPIPPSFTTDEGDEPGCRVVDCPECDGELEVAPVISQGERVANAEADRQAARDGYNPNR